MTGRVVDHATAHRAALIATIWVPLAIVVASEAVVIGVGGTGSSQLIVQCGRRRGSLTGRGGPTRFWSPRSRLPVIALIGFFIARSTRMAGMNAWMPAVAMAITVFHTVGMGVGPVVLNHSPLVPALPLGGGVTLAIAAGLLTWRLLPREAPATTSVEASDGIPVRHGEVAAWTGRVETRDVVPVTRRRGRHGPHRARRAAVPHPGPALLADLPRSGAHGSRPSSTTAQFRV